MDLRDVTRLCHGGCFVCRWSGNHIVLWPQSPASRPQFEVDLSTIDPWDKDSVAKTQGGTYTTGHWQVFVKVHRNHSTVGKVRTGYQSIEVCVKHWEALYFNWEDVARSDLLADTQWHNYLDRTEG